MNDLNFAQERKEIVIRKGVDHSTIAQEYINSNNLVVKIDSEPATIRENFTVMCPNCGVEIDISGVLLDYVSTILNGNEENIMAWGGASGDAPWYGLPCVYWRLDCDHCENSHSFFIFYKGW